MAAGLWATTEMGDAAGASKVVIVEPSPEAQECIRRNLKTELASGQVILYPKGLEQTTAISGVRLM
jgi:predicted RNA methylase